MRSIPLQTWGATRVAIAVALGLAVAGCGRIGLRSSAPQHLADAVPTAARTYSDNCAACHGEELRGGQGPSLVDDVWTSGSREEDIHRAIASGVPDRGMPGFGSVLGESTIRGLVAFIREARTGALDRTAAGGPIPRSLQHSHHHDFSVELLADDLGVPFSGIWLTSTTMLVSEREQGRLRTVDVDGKVGAPIEGAPPVSGALLQGGLLGLARDPEFDRNGLLYLAYTDEVTDPRAADACAGNPRCSGLTAHVRVLRARLRSGQLTDREVIWRAPSSAYGLNTANYGGRLTFDRAGFLYLSIGDRGIDPLSAQDLRSPNGKIHRFHGDGSIPSDNPFADEPGAMPSIWSLGHRNPQGLAIHPQTGELWEAEHGPRGGDELNRIELGGNYGWPYLTYGLGYDGRPFDMTQPLGANVPVRAPLHEGLPKFDSARSILPVAHWTPSIAISAIRFYEGAAFPAWHNDLLVASLRRQMLVRVRLDDGRAVEMETLLQGLGEIRDVLVSDVGEVYLLLSNPGRIVRLRPAS